MTVSSGWCHWNNAALAMHIPGSLRNAKSQIPRAGHLFSLAWASCLGQVRCCVGLPTRTACYEWGQVSWENLGGNRSFVGGYHRCLLSGSIEETEPEMCVCVYVYEGIFYANYPCLLSEPGVELRLFFKPSNTEFRQMTTVLYSCLFQKLNYVSINQYSKDCWDSSLNF